MQPPKLTKTDAQFAKDGLEFMHGAASVPVADLNELFSKVHCLHCHNLPWISSSPWSEGQRANCDAGMQPVEPRHAP